MTYNIHSGEFIKTDKGNRRYWENQYYYLSDAGIPNKDGVFAYKQQRRAFKSLKAALKYYRDQQTPENLRKWVEEDEENQHLFGV